MAQKLVLKSADLPFIWNLSGHVGPGSENANMGTDVELLKVLLAIAHEHPSLRRFGINGDNPMPSRTPTFDPVLGFWIFRLQQLGRHTGDGIASPARGVFFAPDTPWVIVSFNRFARETDPELWAQLNRNNAISPALRAELSR